MYNNIGVYHLFEGLDKVRKEFHSWCKESGEFCEYDLDILENVLYLPVIGNTEKFIHFHKGNILDFVESKGWYINVLQCLPGKGYFEVSKDNTMEIAAFSNGRKEAELDAIRICLELIEKVYESK